MRHSTILLLQMGRVSFRCNSLCYHHMGFGSPAAQNTYLVGHLPQCFQGFSPFRTPMITSQTANTLGEFSLNKRYPFSTSYSHKHSFERTGFKFV